MTLANVLDDAPLVLVSAGIACHFDNIIDSKREPFGVFTELVSLWL